jgi:hypothetical protein
MGFGRQQRLNAADTDKYSHFEEAKCTFIGTKLVEKMSRLRKTGHLLACLCRSFYSPSVWTTLPHNISSYLKTEG